MKSSQGGTFSIFNPASYKMSFPHLSCVAVRNSDFAATSESQISVMVGRQFTDHQLALLSQRPSGKFSGYVTMENIKGACLERQKENWQYHCLCPDTKKCSEKIIFLTVNSKGKINDIKFKQNH